MVSRARLYFHRQLTPFGPGQPRPSDPGPAHRRFPLPRRQPKKQHVGGSAAYTEVHETQSSRAPGKQGTVPGLPGRCSGATRYREGSQGSGRSSPQGTASRGEMDTGYHTGTGVVALIPMRNGLSWLNGTWESTQGQGIWALSPMRNRPGAGAQTTADKRIGKLVPRLCCKAPGYHGITVPRLC